MTNSTDLMQLYILLSYEKLQRSTISQHQRPIEASLRNRLLVWRFLKKIENEPITTINYEQEFFTNNSDNNTLEDDNSWILDLNTNFHDDMDIESDLVNVVSNNEINSINNSTCETMNIDQTSDVNLLLKRAIGAERRQKPLTDNLYFNEDNNNNDNNTNLPQISQSNTFEESEQFFHDLCAELTNTTAALVSSSTTNILNFSSSAEQTLIH
ncbi:unnamed protein product [Adineta steineri]|uniref:Uncharacterized protein n=1 Tax=Adineta steineri TaxID=433720 RepID=A0A818QWV8_9BILA|nr:unnamed protein product [Adineta steineri]CAF0869638.1 unnamed protein product [Adineta steineri]CAF3644955.1 unnamed protein product [Adineta steineri]CAF3689476.1 unnamed protein product [Adineta steineri]